MMEDGYRQPGIHRQTTTEGYKLAGRPKNVYKVQVGGRWAAGGGQAAGWWQVGWPQLGGAGGLQARCVRPEHPSYEALRMSATQHLQENPL